MSDQTIMEILDSLYDDNSDPTSEHIEAIESEAIVVPGEESKTTLPVSTFYKTVPSIEIHQTMSGEFPNIECRYY